MTLGNDRAPLLYYIKLCAAFQSHWYIQTGVTVRTLSIQVKIGNFLSCVTLRIDGWPWKTIGHLFYTTSSFVYHFKSISEVKLELQSGSAQFGSKLVICCPAWHWNLMDDLEKTIGYLYTTLSFVQHLKPLAYSNWSYSLEMLNSGQKMTLKTIGHPAYAASNCVHHFIAIGEFKLELQSGNAQYGSKSTIFFSRVTLKFDGWPYRAPLLGNITLCASFHRNMWIQTGVTVMKRLNGVMTSVTLILDLHLLDGHHVCQCL